MAVNLAAKVRLLQKQVKIVSPVFHSSPPPSLAQWPIPPPLRPNAPMAPLHPPAPPPAASLIANAPVTPSVASVDLDRGFPRHHAVVDARSSRPRGPRPWPRAAPEVPPWPFHGPCGPSTSSGRPADHRARRTGTGEPSNADRFWRRGSKCHILMAVRAS